MRPFAVLLPIIIYASACGNLTLHPADKLVIEWADNTELKLIQNLDPVRLRFSVKGCTDFEVQVETVTDESVRVTKLLPQPQSNSVFEGSSYAEALRPTMECGKKQSSGALLILSLVCKTDGRTARSGSRALVWSAATQYTPTSPNLISNSPLIGLYPDPPGTQRRFPEDAGITDWFAHSIDLSYRARGSASGTKELKFADVARVVTLTERYEGPGQPSGIREYTSHLLVTNNRSEKWLPSPSGGQVRISGVEVEVAEFDESVDWWLPIDPKFPFEFFQSGKELLLVSETSDFILVSQGYLLNSFQIRAVLFRHSDPSSLLAISAKAASPKVFTFGEIRDLDLNVETEFPINNGTAEFVMRDDGQAWAYESGDNHTFWMGGVAIPPQRLPIPDFGYGWAQMTFLANGSVVVVMNGRVALAQTTPSPIAIELSLKVEGNSKYEPRALWPVAIPGGGFGVVTQGGVQLFDNDGHRTGGADPLPAECSQYLTPQLVSALAPGRLGVAGRNGVFIFHQPAGSQ